MFLFHFKVSDRVSIPKELMTGVFKRCPVPPWQFELRKIEKKEEDDCAVGSSGGVKGVDEENVGDEEGDDDAADDDDADADASLTAALAAVEAAAEAAEAGVEVSKGATKGKAGDGSTKDEKEGLEAGGGGASSSLVARKQQQSSLEHLYCHVLDWQVRERREEGGGCSGVLLTDTLSVFRP
jgi:hypothetical protein